MRLIPARAWALILTSAVLQIAIFPVAGPLPLWRAALAWVALVPLLLALVGDDRSGAALRPRHTALLGYGCGICWYMGNCYWIFDTMHLYGGLPKLVALVILILFSFYLGLYHALFGWLVGLLRHSTLGVGGALLVAPFAWVAVELARARVTGFPWDLLGYSQVDNLILMRLAPLAGVMVISWLIVSINAVFLLFFYGHRVWRRAAPVTVVLFAAILLLGWKINFDPFAPNSYLPTAVMMQENLEVGAVGKTTAPLSISQELEEFSAWSLDAEHGSNGGWYKGDTHHPDIIIWPEAPSHFQSNDPGFLVALGKLARARKSAVIAGSLGVDRAASAPRGYFLYDSGSLFDAAGDYSGRYDKIHLVPWGEYIPFKQLFSFADKLTEGVGDMDRGHDRSVFSTGSHSYGVFICYESIFGDEVREFAKNGAEVLVNISDDGWYGDSGAPWQHLNMARMRAIENHRWVLRSTNTGITTAIDPKGRMQAQAPRHVRAAFAFPFAFTKGTTFYTRHGDWFAWICGLVTLLALVFRSGGYLWRSERRV